MSRRRQRACLRYGPRAAWIGMVLAGAALAVAAPPPGAEPWIERSRLLIPDLDLVRSAGRPGEPLELRLFDDARFTAVADRVRREEAGLVWRGHLRGEPATSQVLLVVEGDAVAGRVELPGRTFRIRPLGGGIHRIEQIDESRMPGFEGDALPPPPALAPPAAVGAPEGRPLAGAGAEPTRLDVLALYTPAAERASGGKSGIRAIQRLHAEAANQALEASRAKMRFRLVKQRRVSYREASTIKRDLEILRFSEAGEALWRAHVLRDRFGADFVILYVDQSRSGLCGISYIGWSERLYGATGVDPASAAFSVARPDCLDLVMAHELGHGMGLFHARADYEDPNVNDSWGAFPYSYGFRDEPHGFMTVMGDRCRTCVRLWNYSNPKVRVDGHRTGVRHTRPDGANAVRSMNKVRAEIAGHRPCKVDCGEP